jgi:hypothetical protein
VQAAGLVADLVVDVVVAEQAAALLRPLLLAEPPPDAALAAAEASSYLGVHRKYLSPLRGEGHASSSNGWHFCLARVCSRL